MKRMASIFILLFAFGVMASSLASKPIPTACDVLLGIDIAATLGAGTTFAPGFSTENDEVRLSLCTAETPDLSARMALMVRESLGAAVPDANTLRAQMIDEFQDTIGASVVIEDRQIGDAASWVNEIGQLTVWHRGGRVMFIFSPTPMQDHAAAEAAAQKVLTSFP